MAALDVANHLAQKTDVMMIEKAVKMAKVFTSMAIRLLTKVRKLMTVFMLCSA